VTTPRTSHEAEFDAFAANYESALQQGIRLSGEDSSYFARRRVEWVGRRARECDAETHSVLDFGCGTGSTTQFLLTLPDAERVIGVDVSAELLRQAQRNHGSTATTFIPLDAPPPTGIDLAYCNGVFHHIPPAERARAVAYVYGALRPGGLFAFWENNPWNPGTRMVMRRIPFDRDAETLSPPEARRLLRAGRFEIERTDFLFLFPRALQVFRPLERPLVGAPLGAQYLVLARKAMSSTG
jgi:SAM-dependent methyltransferase